jgi:hypothetical protein
MVKAIGGKYKFSEGKFFFQQGNLQERKVQKQPKYGNKTETVFIPVKGCELSNNMTAEGFRKIGILQQLLHNMTLNPGVSGPFFWDEPEANMNPKLRRFLVEILLELSRNGQQIILVTHDYVLLKWFDLLYDKSKDDHIRFHSLYRDTGSGEVRIESTDDYLKITPNDISETFNNITIEQVSRKMGGLGK